MCCSAHATDHGRAHLKQTFQDRQDSVHRHREGIVHDIVHDIVHGTVQDIWISVRPQQQLFPLPGTGRKKRQSQRQVRRLFQRLHRQLSRAGQKIGSMRQQRLPPLPVLSGVLPQDHSGVPRALRNCLSLLTSRVAARAQGRARALRPCHKSCRRLLTRVLPAGPGLHGAGAFSSCAGRRRHRQTAQLPVCLSCLFRQNCLLRLLRLVPGRLSQAQHLCQARYLCQARHLRQASRLSQARQAKAARQLLPGQGPRLQIRLRLRPASR